MKRRDRYRPGRVVRLLAAAALVHLPAVAEEVYWPSPDEWKTSSPGEAGMEAGLLEEALSFARERNSNGVVVVHGGRIVTEGYWNGWNSESTSDMCSAQKSITSTLVGIALEEGLIRDLDQSASDFLTEWKGTPKEEITIRHMVAMRSGLHSSRRSDLLKALRADDQAAYALALDQEHPPGTAWAYCNPAYGLVITLMERATGKGRNEYAREKLFEPLGMTHTECKWITLSDRFRLKHHGANSSCRDMARFGLMVLRGGRWQDRQIVSEEYLRKATGKREDMVNPAYGYLWWLNGSESYQLPYDDEVHRGMLFPNCPPDTIAALGARDSKIYIIPSLDLVVTRLGENATEDGRVAPSEFDDPFLSKICQAAGYQAPEQEARPKRGNRTYLGARMLTVEFETEEEAMRNLLPPPLEPGSEPLGLAFVAHYPETTFGSVYYEGAVFLLARYGEHEGWYCLAMPVDDRRAMRLGRRLLGYPKELADISLERDGKQLTGRVVFEGKELICIEATLGKEGEAPDVLTGRPHLNVIPISARKGSEELAAGATLLKLEAAVDVHSCEGGEAELRLNSSESYPLPELPIVAVRKVFYVEQDMGGPDGSIERIPIR